MKQCEFDALTSLSFNIGVENFSKSTLVRKINAKVPIAEIEKEFRKWVYAGGKILPGLKARREREIKLYKVE